MVESRAGIRHSNTGSIMEKLRYSRVLLKLSGEALAGEQKFGIEPKAIGTFCREIADRFYAMDRGVVTISGPIATLTDEVVKKHLQV